MLTKKHGMLIKVAENAPHWIECVRCNAGNKAYHAARERQAETLLKLIKEA